MNKELEEAVGILKIMIENLKEYGIYHSTTDEEQQAIETVLEELKRLQEENEELKLEKRTRIIGRYGEMEIHEVINKTLKVNYIQKDKIREKIKEQNELKEKYPNYYNQKITNHSFRHSKAMHLLEAGVNLVYIRDILGHKSITTTEIYAKTNPEIKRKAIENNSQSIKVSDKYSSENKNNLLHWLKNYVE